VPHVAEQRVVEVAAEGEIEEPKQPLHLSLRHVAPPPGATIAGSDASSRSPATAVVDEES